MLVNVAPPTIEIWAESAPGAGAAFCFTLPPLADARAPLASAA